MAEFVEDESKIVYTQIGDTGISYRRDTILGTGISYIFKGRFRQEDVAFKKIQLENFIRREIEFQNQFNHGVVDLITESIHQDFRYIVQELCSGDLNQLIYNIYKIPHLQPDEELLYQTDDVLDSVHSLILAEREGRPENVANNSKTGQIQLYKAGKCKRGNPIYMAINLLSSLFHDNSSDANWHKTALTTDIFSIGRIFFVFLTYGTNPNGKKFSIFVNFEKDNPANISEVEINQAAIRKTQEEERKLPLLEIKEWISTLCKIANLKNQENQTREQLGKGSYGTVHKDLYTDSNGKTFPVAYKKYSTLPGNDKSSNKEIEVLKRMNNLFVIRYLEVVTKDSIKYIVMELCEGTLKEYVNGGLEKIPQNSLDDKIISSQITLGLAYLHDQHIIHRELKPDNILLWCHPTNRELVLAKVTNFRILNQEIQSKQLRDDPEMEDFMAPELVHDKRIYPASIASDVYSLGVMIGWIALKGKHPFSPENIVQTQLMISGVIPLNLEKLSWELQDLVLKLTDNDPEKRPNIGIVLHHPYFVLTNEKTIWQFINELWRYFDWLGSEEQKKVASEIFDVENFEKWYESLSDYSTPTEEDHKKRNKLKQFLKRVPVNETLYNIEDYQYAIKEDTKSQYGVYVGNKLDKVLYHPFWNTGVSPQRLYKLIEHEPKLISLYVWSQMATRLSSTCRNSQINWTRISDHLVKQHFRNTISDLVWSSLLYNKKEISDELWILKYESEQYKKYEIVDTATSWKINMSLVECDITERIWLLVLNRIEDVSPLLFASVQSLSSIAPKMTEIILKERGWPSWLLRNHEKLKTPLHIAVLNHGKYGADIVKVLLDNGADPNTVDPQDSTPVHYAASNESRSAVKIIKYLLEMGGDPNRVSLRGYTPVHFAARNEGNYAHKILKKLLKYGGAYDAVYTVKSSGKWLKPIHFATMNRGNPSWELMQLLVGKHRNNANVICGVNLWMPVHLAVHKNGDLGPKILKKLLKNGAEPNPCDEKGRTPLHLAVQLENDHTIEMMKIILNNKRRPNAKDNQGQTPVHYATKHFGKRAPAKLKLLLDKGGDPTMKDKKGLTPVHFSLLNIGDYGPEIRKLLPINQENVNAPVNDNGDTLLHCVIVNQVDDKNKIKHVQILLDNGADPNVKNNLGLSVVHVEVARDSSLGSGILKLLLEKGGNPNLPDKENGSTPVHYVAWSRGGRAIGLMKLLLDKGGDPNTQDKNKFTPVHVAAKNFGTHASKLTRMLIECGGDLNRIKDSFQRLPLHLAIRNRNDKIRLKIVMELLNKGANPNAKDAYGETPVHYVVLENRKNSLEIIMLLVVHDGKVNVPRYKDNMTPLSLANQPGSIKYCSSNVREFVRNIRDGSV